MKTMIDALLYILATAGTELLHVLPFAILAGIGYMLWAVFLGYVLDVRDEPRKGGHR